MIEHEHMPDQETHEAGVAETIWKQQETCIKQILQQGFESFEEPILAGEETEGHDHALCLECIDDRIEKDRVAMAGSGVLLTDEQRSEAARNIAAQGIDIKSIKRHTGCGAEGLKKAQLKAQGMNDEEIETEIARQTQDFADKLSKELGHPVTVEKELSEMLPGAETHIARGAVLTAAKNYSQEAQVRHGFRAFQISALAYPDPETAISETALAATIAFGSHGYGKERFVGDHKFVLGIIADPSTGLSAEEWQQKMEAFLDSQPNFKEDWQQHIIVQAIEAPLPAQELRAAA